MTYETKKVLTPVWSMIIFTYDLLYIKFKSEYLGDI